MELLAGVAAFLGVVNSVFSLVTQGKIILADDKAKVAALLNDIGQLIKEVAEDLDQNRYPHEKCSIMFEYMNGMKAKLQDKMDDGKLQQLQENIEQCYRVEQLLGQLNQLTSDQKQYNIDMMRSIAGRFIGLSKLL